MRRALPLILGVLTATAIGCTPTTEPAKEAAAPPAPEAPTPANNASGVNVMPSAAGGMAPVTGAENLQGGGGYGVGSAAKDKARSMGGVGGSSLDQLPLGDQ